MKFPLHLRRPFGEWWAFAFITIRAPRVRPVPIEALVDTGSPWISITPKDLSKLNIPVKRLKKAAKYTIVSLGGYKFLRYQLGGTVYIKNEGGKMLGVNLPISVLWPTKKKWPADVKHIPSILGSDFLRVGRFHLHFNPSKEKAFLQREDIG